MTDQYDKSVVKLVEKFIDTYYSYGEDDKADYDIISFGERAPGPVEINDYYRSISDIYDALKYKIPKDKLFERYDYSLNKHRIKETCMNLICFSQGAKEYTKEEMEEDERKIAETYKLLEDSILSHKNK